MEPDIGASAFDNPLVLEESEEIASADTSSAKSVSLNLRDEHLAERETGQTKDTDVFEQQLASTKPGPEMPLRRDSVDAFETEAVESGQPSRTLTRELPTHKEWMNLVAEEDVYLGITPTGAAYSYKYRKRKGNAYMAGASFGVWKTSSNFRQTLFVCTQSRAFEGFILLSIVFQAALMALTIAGDHAANLEKYPYLDQTLDISEKALLIIYTIEMAMKMVAFGAYESEHAYLRNAWNTMDCFLVCFGWFYVALKVIGMPHLLNPSIVRLVRCLRPLRTMSFMQGVRAALNSWPFLANIGLLLGLDLVLFGVLGVQLFGGATSYLCVDGNLNESISCPTQLACEMECMALPRTETPVWGFDNILQALLSGWVAVTGDMWTPNMVEVYSQSESRYAASAWMFFICWSVLFNLVFANLFTAVIINSFLEHHKKTDAAVAADVIQKEITLFNRIDADRSGTIATTELETLAIILDLDKDLFTRDELQEACDEMDVTGDGTVDFEEFMKYWNSNSQFVIKLKKALLRQENAVREAWEKIDADGSGLLDKDELMEMAHIMHIELSNQELTLAMDEMDAADDEVSFEAFSNWWLGPSKIAAKVKSASKIKENGEESTRMFLRIDADGSEGLDVDEVISGARLAFARTLSDEEGQELFKQALPAGATEGSEIFVEDFERWWKSSDSDLAKQLREERRQDSIKIREFVESLSAVEQQVLSPLMSTTNASPGNVLGRDELEEVISVLKLHCSVADLNDAIERNIPAQPNGAGTAEADDVFEARASFKAATSAADYVKPVEVLLVDFTEWMISPDPLAEKALAELDRQIVARQLAADRPFPFVPGMSPACRFVNNSPLFEKFMILAIIMNTALMATNHHEQETKSPGLTKFVADSDEFFTILYVVEVIVRSFGMGFKAYATDSQCVFDFLCTATVFVGYVIPAAGYASAFRSLRVLTKILRVVRSASVVLRADQVQYVLTTVLEKRSDLTLLGVFLIFMLVLMAIVGGHTLGNCHIHGDGSVDEELPPVNFFTFWQSFHAVFLIMMGQRWSEVMYDYMDPNRDQSEHCTDYSWIFFVLCFSVLKFFAGNLFVAMIIDGFTLSESEKLVKQEKNHLQSMAQESNILREMGMGSGASLGGVIDGFKAMRDGGAQDVLMDGLKEVPKPSDVMKLMSSNARVKKLSGPMAQMKKEMGRQGTKLNSLADKASGGQLKKLQEEAEQRLKAVQEEMEHLALEAKRNAMDAGNKAATLATTTAMEKMEEAKRRAEAGLAEAAAKLDEQHNKDAQLQALGPSITPEERKKALAWNIFAPENNIRKFCVRTVDNPQFEPAVMTLICISGVSIAAEGPPGNHELADKPTLANLFHTINIGILVVFWLEFLLHTIADGFAGTPGAYLKKAWHRMDFFVLITCTVEFFATYVGEGDAIRILRVMRVWRPLQLLKHNDAITVLLEALANVFPLILGVLALMFVFYTSFAIFATGVFMGAFASCNCDGKWALPKTNCTASDPSTLSMDDCIAQGGTWENPPYNFDSFGYSMKSLFYTATGGLKIIAQSAMDFTEPYKAPVQHASSSFAAFFWIFSVLNKYFIQSLLIGLLCNSFLQASGSALLTSSQQQWAQCQIFVLMTEPFVKPLPDKQTARRQVYDIVNNPMFDRAISVVVCVNIAVMLVDAVPQDTQIANMTHTTQEVCTLIFVLDVAMSVFAHSWSDYWKDPWCKLDVTIVVLSLASKMIDVTWISVIRGVRMFRILTLIKRFKNLRPIIRSMLVSLVPCMNVFGVVALFLCIFAVTAMNLYGLVPHGHTRYGIDASNNFDSFPNAFVFLSQMVAGHPYIHVVYELENHDKPFPFLFFGIFTVLMQWVLVNLFVVILLDNFMKCFVVSKMDITEDDVATFKEAWSEAKTDPGGLFGGKPFTTKPDCKSMDVRMLEEFVPYLLPPTETLDTHLHISTGDGDVFNSLKDGDVLNSLYSLSSVSTNSLKLFKTIDISPLGMIVPHRLKHNIELAMPFEAGQIGHIDGQLVEIVSAKWDSDLAREEGLPPSAVSVKWLESEEIDATRMLGEDGMHVPAVEKMIGLVDGDRYEITWVSNDRTRIRVQEASRRKKRFASNRIEKSNGTPDWLTRGRPESPKSESDVFTVEEEQQREQASIKLQASYRGYTARQEVQRRRQDEERRRRPAKISRFRSEDGGSGKMGTTQTVLPTLVRKVTVEGDQFWLNRLIVELGISSQEAADGFRYLPDGVKLTDEDGRFLPVVVGLRALPTGQFVQDVRVGFHELLLALCLIQMSYGGLNYQERQAKMDKLRKRGQDHAARIFQTCARCKFAKRHLVKTPPNLNGKPLKRWSKFHSTNGQFDGFSDPACIQRMLFVRSAPHLHYLGYLTFVRPSAVLVRCD